jgi:hypothetical protein
VLPPTTKRRKKRTMSRPLSPLHPSPRKTTKKRRKKKRKKPYPSHPRP